MKYFGMSDVGMVRRSNQDSYMISYNEANDTLAVVCDGIGGGKSGDVASNLTTRHLCEAFAKVNGFTSIEQAQEWVVKQIRVTNDYVFTKSTTQATLQGMGTTLVGVFIGKLGSFIFNVGDSRGYSINQDLELIQVTKDHTLVEELLQKGEITKEQAKDHPKRHVLTNAIGAMGKIKVDTFKIGSDTKYILLCSDGLHGLVSEKEIQTMIVHNRYTVQTKVKKLIEMANLQGGSDNITIVLIEMGQVI